MAAICKYTCGILATHNGLYVIGQGFMFSQQYV
jgi:hypothetical protein